MKPADHADCREFLRTGFAAKGCDVVISTEPPLVRTGYDQDPFKCPHGVVLYAAPTSEQIAQWAADGVE